MHELRNIGDSVKRRRLGKFWERFSAPETWLNILFWGYIFVFFFSLSPSLSSMVLRIFSVDPRRAVRLCGLFRKMLFLGAAVFALFAVFGLGLGKASTVTFILRFADVRKRATLGFGKRSVRRARALWNRYSAWQSALIDKTEAHGMLVCLLNLCKVDLFAFCWVAVFAAQFFLCRYRDGGVLAWMLMPVPVFVLGVQMGEGTLRRPEKGRQLLLSVFANGTSVCALLLAARFETVSFMILDGDRTAGMLRFLLLLAVGLIVLSLALAFAATAENLECRAYAFVKMVVVTLMLYLLVEILLWVMIIPIWPRVAHYLRRIFLSPMLSFNAFFALLSVLTLWSIFGARITGTLCCVAGMLLVIGNLIKTVYHATLLTPGDLLSIKELFLIMPGYIGGAGIAALLSIAGGVCYF